MFGLQGRQDPDHDDAGPNLIGLGLGVRQRSPEFGLQVQHSIARHGLRVDIEFDVVLPEFGLVGRIGDICQHLGVGHCRIQIFIDQVELDFQTGELAVEFEGVLDQHPFEDVQALADFFAVELALFPSEMTAADVVAHVRTSA